MMDRDASIAEARAMLLRRKKRELFFNPALLGEPAWDVLLLLYAFSAGDGTYSVDEVIEIVSAPMTVVRRWLSVLQSEGLIEQRPRGDAPAGLVRLTHMGLAKLDTYFGCAP